MKSESPVLRGRRQECAALDDVLRDLRAGQSRVLVLRGEAGAGKTALLDYLADAAPAGRTTRAAGVEPEAEIAYSALQQLCSPLLAHLDRLPQPQRDALSTAFGMSPGQPPEPLVLGMAVLGLLAEAAAGEPLICIVDDVQWMDRASEVILTFVARRLHAESVALVLAARTPGDEQLFGGLPELRIEGLPEAEARALLESVLPGPIEDRVRERIVAETRGNPLALLELPRGLSATELAFGFGLPGSAPLAGRLEESFRRRIAELPSGSRLVLLTAAVEPVGDLPLLWRALDVLGVGPEAAGAVEDARLVEFGATVRFRHPLVRSASWRAADAAELRAVHGALAAVTDPVHDPDRRAWHRAHAAVGPDALVAAELEQSADRALARGGRAAAAAFLQRAAELTPDSKQRAGRALAAARAQLVSGAPELVLELLAAAELGPLDPPQRAEADRLRAHLAFARNDGRDAAPALLEVARRLEDLDPGAARQTYLEAMGSALNAGEAGAPDLRHAAQAAGALPMGEDVTSLLLQGFVARTVDGYAASVPWFARALAMPAEERDLAQLWLAVPVAFEVFDDAALHRLTEHAVRSARATGTLAVLPSALFFRAGALMFAGRFADASDMFEEADALGQTTGLAPHPSAALALFALQGKEDLVHARVTAMTTGAEVGDARRLLSNAAYGRAVLHNGLGNYAAAASAARTAVEHENIGLSMLAVPELVEAAARSGNTALAEWARAHLEERTRAAGTPWALGVQALADALAGPAEQADERYREAIAHLGTGRLALLQARARLLHGEFLRRDNRRGAAREALRMAHEALVAMGADGFAERAGRELVATGETVRRRAPGLPGDLTSQETQIARLAVAGRSNPEIGATLFLSPRTVEWHLRKVFMKLGITSRRELGAVLLQQPR
ncbi:LuxR family transcriptional regulator [Kribbella sp. ALI-6-A]|uniref:helix-turn-helix transcriptional regulator n=1 Tax=Kribbella sp. ALI-6-A TaxID=1933817 RepID=UPI00097CA50C|nr:AAA family ATPase [Kribbella sp. ALI-6-A]ONI74055.1 LuxR family transcriptional regulator [Kribbella sp. ALI-6-A]